MEAWGKFDKSSGRVHRLEHHCADVAACFEALLRDPVLRMRFVRAAGAEEFTDTTAARLTFLAYLHDFGKLNAGFQFKVRPRAELPSRPPRPAGHIAQALLCFDQPDICGLLGLHDIVDEWGAGIISLAHAMLAHHGRPARRPTRSGSGPPELWKPFAGYDPRATAKLLSTRGRSWFPSAFCRGPRMPDTPALAHLFAGIVTLADQLGSDEEAFRYEPDPDPDYIERARRIAADVVRSKGFRRRDSMAVATLAGVQDFRSLFDYPDLRPSQRAVTDAPVDRPLLILESETGSGKTEAAILRFAALRHAGLVDGLYFAVPTRAAAMQLHGRVRRALERLFPPAAHVETVLAVPGYLVVGDAEGRRVERFDVYWEDEPDEEKRLARWSAESARKFLSASAAVGTVDQVLLAGLRVKWAHFRAASVSRSLLVVDEVHASDDYMTALLLGVLKGHLVLGGHALLMSATLGAAADALLRKWLTRLPHPFSSSDREQGISYDISMLQAEFARTEVFDRPVAGRVFFEEVMRENLDMGRPDHVQLIFDRRVSRRTPTRHRTRVITDGVIPSLHVDYKHSRIKQYHKEGRALRTETVINDTYDFDVGRRLKNLDDLKQIGFAANRRLLGVQKLSHDCTIGAETLADLHRPAHIDGQRASALRFGDPRVQALLAALLRFDLLPAGFRNRELREAVAPLRGMSVDDYKPGQMTYDLRRLRLRGLIERIPHSQRYRLTAEGLCIALAYHRTQARVLGPVLSATLDGESTTRLQAAIAAYDREVCRRWEGNALAA